MINWWQKVWGGSLREAQFLMEARYTLPGISDDSPKLDDFFVAALHQRARLRQNQQLMEWQASFDARSSRLET